jgi:hypothetical protein
MVGVGVGLPRQICVHTAGLYRYVYVRPTVLRVLCETWLSWFFVLVILATMSYEVLNNVCPCLPLFIFPILMTCLVRLLRTAD